MKGSVMWRQTEEERDGENRGNEEVRIESGGGPGGGRKERTVGGRETGGERGEWRTL